MGFPLFLWVVTAPLGGVGATERCRAQWMEYTRPPQLEQYEQCQRDKTANSNMSVPGAAMGIRAECWCQNNMRDLVEEHHCCNDPNYAFLCQIECDKDCSTPEATTCMSKCPSMCLEWDYEHQFELCDCRQNNCATHTLCIVEQGQNRTQSGELAPICDDPAFEASAENQAFYQCLREYPMRTNWHRHQSTRHCICKSNLKAALERHNCCGSSWGKPLCEATCEDSTTCNSDEAKQCLEDCGSTCTIVYPNRVLESCYNQCFDPEASCATYKSCEPVEQADLGYVCMDGSSPKSNGCCDERIPTSRTPFTVETCPSVCDVREKYILPHGIECQCLGCPSSVEDAENKLKELLVDEAVVAGQEQLLSIARWLGLDYPTAKMQELMTERNREIQEIIEEHEGPRDPELSFKIREKSREWNNKILDAGREEKRCQEDPDCEDDDDKHHRGGRRGRRIVVLVICSVLGGLLLILAILIMIYLIRRKPRANRGAAAVSSNGNVVVGRPVNEAPVDNDGTAKGSPLNA